MNHGHGDLSCAACHRPERGTLRQQLQAQIAFALGRRGDWVHFGRRPVDNETCLTCHDRPNTHPVSRFLEPRFAQARAEIAPQFCASCHAEHNGVRVTIRADFCASCHRDTVVRSDPLDTPHAELFRQGRWQTCLGCHDYHGNHAFKAPVRMADAFPTEAIVKHFTGRVEIYPMPVKHPAKKESGLK